MITPITNAYCKTNLTLNNNNKKLNYQSSDKVSFGRNDEEYGRYLEKYNYLEAKTQKLDDVMTASFIGALLLGAHNIDLSQKMNVKQKVALGFAALTGATFAGKIVKKMQLSKEYDKDHIN